MTPEQQEMVRLIIDVILLGLSLAGFGAAFYYKRRIDAMKMTEIVPDFKVSIQHNKLLFVQVAKQPYNVSWEVIIRDIYDGFKSERIQESELPKSLDIIYQSGYERGFIDIKKILFRVYYSGDITNEIKLCKTFIITRLEDTLGLVESKLQVIRLFGNAPKSDIVKRHGF